MCAAAVGVREKSNAQGVGYGWAQLKMVSMRVAKAGLSRALVANSAVAMGEAVAMVAAVAVAVA
ncbi:MAG: hypothetical protein ACRCT2_07000, partial [Plesiomonas shigelloides]